MPSMNSIYIDKTRARFNQLRMARDCGTHTKPEQLWNTWKVQIETWSHEYWLLTLELKQIRKIRDVQRILDELRKGY